MTELKEEQWQIGWTYDGEDFCYDADTPNDIDLFQDGEIGVQELWDNAGEPFPEDFDWDKFSDLEAEIV